jgi:bacteriocin-like protein
MEYLSNEELFTINGGHVPTAYYMDSDVINANRKAMDAVVSYIAGFFVGFFD